MRLYVILAGLLTCAAAGPALAGPVAEASAEVFFSTNAGSDLVFNSVTTVQSTSTGNGTVSISGTANSEEIAADVITSLDSYGESSASENISISTTITNISSIPYSGAVIGVFFSASRGSGTNSASTDIGLAEDANFSAGLGGGVSGSPIPVQDQHACTLSPSTHEAVGTIQITTSDGQNHCSVPSPDYNENDFYIFLAPGASETLGAFSIGVSAHVDWAPIPEPTSVGLFAIGIVALISLHRRGWRGYRSAAQV